MVPPPDAGISPSKSLEDVYNAVRRTRTVAAVMATDLGDMPTVHALRQLMEADKPFINVNDSDNQSRIVPAFGVHPWYSYKYYIPSSSPSEGSMDAPLTGAAKAAHYAAVLAPAPDAAFVAALPDPVSFVPVLHQIEAWLVQWPDAIMGECGLDKIFRVPNPFYADVNDTTPQHEQHEQQPKFSKYTVRIAHQTAFLRLQLELAARYARPVSLHCVKAPTALLDLVHTMALAEGIAPPALCLHSYTGSVEYLVNNWYTTTKLAKKQQQQNQKPETDSCNYINPATMPLSASLPRVYVSLSEFFNNDARHQSVFAELVRAVPPDRLLLESDHYVAEGDWAAMNEAVAASVAAALGVPVMVVVNRARQNFNEFCRMASV